MHQRGNTELPCRGPLLKIAQYCDTHPTVISSAARFVRERTDLAESRNLLFCRVQQQVPRLRSAIRDADDGTPLGMTDRVGVSLYSANLSRRTCMWEMSFNLRCAQPVNLCRHDEIALGQAVDLVGPQRDLGLAPCQQNVRMMSLLLGQSSHAIDELERLLEVGELELAVKVMFLRDCPLGDALV